MSIDDGSGGVDAVNRLLLVQYLVPLGIGAIEYNDRIILVGFVIKEGFNEKDNFYNDDTIFS